MIVNTTIYNGDNADDIIPPQSATITCAHTRTRTNTANVSTDSNVSNISNEYENILKRKHDKLDKNFMQINGANGKNHHNNNHERANINNDIDFHNDMKNNSIESAVENVVKWKKRHTESKVEEIESNREIIEATTSTSAITTTATTITTTSMARATMLVITAPTAAAVTAITSPAIAVTETQTAAAATTTVTTTPIVAATSAETNAHFNIVPNHHFVNDLINYETNLLIPVTNQDPQNDIDLIEEEDVRIFNASPKAIYVNSIIQQQLPQINSNSNSNNNDNDHDHDNNNDNDDDDNNWHSNDLLELDHRYNSNLQTEINQINPTITLKITEIPGSVQSLRSQQPHFHRKVCTNDGEDQIENFLIPLTAITTTIATKATVTTLTTATTTSKGVTTFSRAITSPASVATSTLQVDLPLIVEEELNNMNGLNMRQQQQQQQLQQHNLEQDYLEDKNLSWLLNFKFDELPHLSPDLTKSGRNISNNNNNNNNSNNSNSNSNNNNYQYLYENGIIAPNVVNGPTSLLPATSLSTLSSTSTAAATAAAANRILNSGNKITINGLTSNKQQRHLQHQQQHQQRQKQHQQQQQQHSGRSTKNATKVNKKFEELVMEVTSPDNNNYDDDNGHYNLQGSQLQQQHHQPQQQQQQQQQQQNNNNSTNENGATTEMHILAQKKPPFTYTELIEYALEDKGELTVSGIYQWISDRFSFYKSNDDRWKNSVRHNLSINPHFRKGIKAPQGAGHLWTIYSSDSAENVLQWEHKKQRLELFFKMEALNRERILQYQQQQQNQQQQHNLQNDENQMKTFNPSQTEYNGGINDITTAYDDEAATAVNAIQKEMMQQQQEEEEDQQEQEQQRMAIATITPITHANNNHCNGMENVLDSNGHVLHTIPYTDLLCNDEELRRTAGQILNGIHREVEVQAVNQNIISTYHDVLLDNVKDYLNPVYKNDALNQNNLRQQQQRNTLTTKVVTTLSSQAPTLSRDGIHYMTSNNNHNSTPQFYVTEIDALELNGFQIPIHNIHNANDSCNNLINDNCIRNSDNVNNSNGICSINGGDCNEDVDLFNDEYNFNYFNYTHNNDTIS